MVKKIKIMQVVHSMPVAGTEKLVYDIVLSLKNSPYSFFICCLDEIGVLGFELQKRGIPVFCMKRKPGYDFSVSIRMIKLIRKHRIDVVHAQQYTPFFTLLFLELFSPSFN